MDNGRNLFAAFHTTCASFGGFFLCQTEMKYDFHFQFYFSLSSVEMKSPCRIRTKDGSLMQCNFASIDVDVFNIWYSVAQMHWHLAGIVFWRHAGLFLQVLPWWWRNTHWFKGKRITRHNWMDCERKIALVPFSGSSSSETLVRITWEGETNELTASTYWTDAKRGWIKNIYHGAFSLLGGVAKMCRRFP